MGSPFLFACCHACQAPMGGLPSMNGKAFAKHAASDLAFGQAITLQTHWHDKYRPTLADVVLPDGTHVNHTLVKNGWSWWYRKYAPGDTVLEGPDANRPNG